MGEVTITENSIITIFMRDEGISQQYTEIIDTIEKVDNLFVVRFQARLSHVKAIHIQTVKSDNKRKEP